MPTSPIGIWIKSKRPQNVCHSPTFTPYNPGSRLGPHTLSAANARRWSAWHDPNGFTLLEMLVALFLLGGILAIMIPRISFEEDLRSTGRTLIGVLRTLQGEAATKQTPLKLYFDLDQGLYWMMLVEGKEERLPLDPAWKTPRALPESIRLTEVSIGPDKHVSGRADVSFFTNGRIEPVTMYLMDSKNNLLGLAVDSLTGGIRVSDERFDIPRTRFIPDRVRTLLKPRSQTGAAGSVIDGLPKPSIGQDAPKQTPNQRQ